MENFQFLSSFKVASAADENNLEHIFYQVKDIELAEKKIGFPLPKELVSFYTKVGYGFFWQNNKDTFDRILSPLQVAQITLREDFYEGDPDLEVYDDLYNDDKLLFFEINEGVYLAMDKADEGGKNKIYYFEKKVFDSLEEFIKELIKNPNLTTEF